MKVFNTRCATKKAHKRCNCFAFAMISAAGWVYDQVCGFSFDLYVIKNEISVPDIFMNFRKHYIS